jgi:aldehyde dehydrogenase (NAD+)
MSVVQEYGLFFNGKWRRSEGKRFETRNPATGDVLATFPMATPQEVAAAIKAAKDAFEKWRKTPAPRLGELLFEAARIIQRRKEELGRVVTSEMGKVIVEGRANVQEAIDFYTYAAGEGPPNVRRDCPFGAAGQDVPDPADARGPRGA